MPSEPSPQHQQFVKNVAPERNEQEPLGPTPSYDQVLDVAVEYTFPASDPLAVENSARDADQRSSPDAGAKPGA